MKPVIEHFQYLINQAAAEQRPLRLRGGGSKDWYGEAPIGELLDTRAYSGIVSYDPAELVITARCGTPLAEIEAALAEQGQMLAFEPPHFGADATFGGCVSAGLSGPRRAAAGALRDFVLGVEMLNGKAQQLRFGGEVMKNVAGYDVARLLAGSLGTLGLILQASLKVLPRPMAETTRQFELHEAEALQALNQWAGQPLPISASAWQDNLLTVRLSGASAAVKAAVAKLGGEHLDEAAASRFWQELREQRAAFFTGSGPQPLWRLALPSTAAPVGLFGKQLIEWGGGQRWWRCDDDAAAIRRRAAELGGHATLYRRGTAEAAVFTPLAEPVLRIHRQLKSAFDPAGIFNPGRMIPGL
jgi:glycolate oxidase FAD binding subunit